MQECFKFRLFCPDKSSKFSSTTVLVTYELAAHSLLSVEKVVDTFLNILGFEIIVLLHD